jgi:hypothetical protein
MPPVIPQHLLDAKKRMKMGLHPAVLAAVQRSVEQAKRQLQQSAPQPALRPRGNTGVVDLGTGVNPGHARAVPPGGDTRAAMDPLAGSATTRSFRATPTPAASARSTCTAPARTGRSGRSRGR